MTEESEVDFIEATVSESAVSDIMGGWMNPAAIMADNADLVFGAGGFPIDNANSRATGEDQPVFRNEIDLQWIRGLARMLARTEWGQAIMESLTAYTVGTGFEWKVKGRGGFDVALTQAVIDDVCRSQSWKANREEEFFVRAVRDGEVFLRIVPSHGQIRLRFVEPAMVAEPSPGIAREIESQFGIGLCSWSFGVCTDADDFETVHGYFIQRQEDWEFVPSSQMVHYKRGVDRAVKRGVSDFFPLRRTLPKALKLAHNQLDGAALQAAIAWIAELPPNTTTTQATAFASSNTTKPDPSFTNRQMKEYPAGTVITTKAGTTYKPGPMGAERNNGFQIVQAAALRQIGTRWNMPEYLISGDASNANYASTLAASAPFGKGRERDQAKLAEKWHEMWWKVFSLMPPASFGGSVPTPADIELGWVAPQNQFTSDAERVQSALGRIQLGISPAVIASELGYDPATDLATTQAETTSESGAFAGISRLQFKRNTKAIEDIISAMLAGGSEAKARTMLAQVGLQQAAIDSLIEDAKDGQIDSVHESAAVDPKIVLQVSELVSEGTLERSAGISQLVAAGMNAKQAGDCLPSESWTAERKALETAWEAL